jgi:3-hydroxyisobutyrate dehydrogenase
MTGKSIGIIGIGRMGWPMAVRVHQAGYDLQVFDIVPTRAELFSSQYGTKTARSCAALARDSDVIITMLPTSKHVEQALTGADGVLQSLKKGAIVIEMSSGFPTETKRFADLVEVSGGVLIDAPVSGGVPRAESGELAIMVGGDTAAFDKVLPILKAMGTTITRVGAIGTAHAMKALNNLVSAGGFLIGIEALLVGTKFGINPEVMVDILNSSTGMNYSTQKKFKQYVLSRTFNSGFSLELMVKDLGNALDLGVQTGTPTPFSALCRELWRAAAVVLDDDEDHTGVAKLSEKLAGFELSNS